MEATIPNDPAPIPADLRRRYLAAGLWDDCTLPTLLLAGLRRHPQQRVRLWSNRICKDESFATLESTALRFAAGLGKRGVSPGDRVIIWLPNGWEALVAFVGAAVLGAVVVPVASFYGRKDIVEIANAAAARVVVTCATHGRRDYLDEVYGSRGELPSVNTVVRCGGGARHGNAIAFEDLLATPDASHPPRSADDVCLLGFTSGTSGTAKAVVHTHHTLCAEVRNHLTVMVPGGAVPQIMASPVAHAAGMTLGLLAPIHRGEPIHLVDSFDADFLLDTAHAEGLAPGGGAAVFLSALIDHPNFTDELAERMRYVILGGSTVPEALVTKAAARGVTVLRSYGLTEHPTVSAGVLSDDPAVLARSDGRLLPGVEVVIRDGAGNALPAGSEGEIFTRGPDRCAGYLQSEMNSAFDSEGWFATEDIGVLDSAGYLAITDRSKDLVIRNGVNIAPAEVENALITHPEVAEVAVVGVPDDRTGERAVAVVVAHRGHAISLTALTDHLAALGVAKPKWPEELRLTDHLPRTASGKVRKNELRKEFS
jgi:acyl-CoA synthetase (AMP-forming)/AMP-acid ligase II